MKTTLEAYEVTRVQFFGEVKEEYGVEVANKLFDMYYDIIIKNLNAVSDYHLKKAEELETKADINNVKF